MSRRLALTGLLLFTCRVAALAQSIPTATLTGKVTADNAPLPGVTVSVASPNLQGTRTAITTAAGDYLLPQLPPGEYRVTFALSGMQTVTRRTTLTAARTEHADLTMRPAVIAEAITVTAETPLTAAIESTQVSTNFKQELIDRLPVQRNLESIALLAPGVSDTGPANRNRDTGPNRQLVISGAMSFDNLYLVDGAVVNENLRGWPHDLFIEDAVQETTILTGGVPAEYGHFTGGVVSMITKSGGNDLKGTFRTSFDNESWTAKTPLTEAQDDRTNAVFEATIGGPFLRDRLWFFGAGRFAERQDVRQTVPGRARAGDRDASGNPIPVGTPITPITYPHSTEDTRLEAKLTGSITAKHVVVASYMDVSFRETNQTAQDVMDLDSLVKEREEPVSFLSLNYNGTLTDRFFVEAMYSNKEKEFVGSGSPYYDLIKGTLIEDRARDTRYWSPTFRNTPEGEQRDIEVLAGKATYFLSTRRLGSHEIRGGYEDFNEVRRVNNYQNGSDYRISVPETIIRGDQIFPRMPGGASGTLTRINWLPIFVLSEGSDYTTHSAYVSDRWALNDKWTFNAGARYEKYDALGASQTSNVSEDSALLPRLAAHYDIFGSGRLIVNASYSQYSGRLSEGAGNQVDPAGRSATLSWEYKGPSINNDVNAPTSSLIPTDKAIQMVFDWFFANGGTTRRPFRTTPTLQGVATVLHPDGLKSPLVNEWTLGVGGMIGTRGYARADFVLRDWDRFYALFRDVSTGKVTDTQYGTNAQYDLAYLGNDSDVYEREYTALQTQFSYRALPRLRIGGTYTWSRLVGNVIGENTNSGPLVANDANSYPEYREARWSYPMGYLPGDQRHRMKLFGSWDVPSRFGDFSISLLESFESGTATSVDATIDSRPFVTDRGYRTPPATVDYFFGGRGTLKTDDITRTDLSIRYGVKLFGRIELFVEPEIVNLFNAQGVVAFDEEVLTRVQCTGGATQGAACPAGGLRAFNPFTEEPVEGTHYLKGPNFGQPTEEDHYQTPRTYRFSVGLRF